MRFLSLPLLRRSPAFSRHMSSGMNNLLDQLEGSKVVEEAMEAVAPPTAGSEGYSIRGPNPMRDKPEANMAERFSIKAYRLHCQATRNNTITTFTDQDGKVINWYSGGRCGFKKGQRSSYEAGYQCAVRIFKDIAEISKEKTLTIDLFLKGFGQGREAIQKALLAAEGETVRPLVRSVTDRTRIKVGGTRAKKARRL